MLSVQTAFLHFEKINSEIVEEKKKRKSQGFSGGHFFGLALSESLKR